MDRSAKYAIELLREWDFHNRKHHCYYEEANDSGVSECPSDFPTLLDFVKSREFPVENSAVRIFGRDLNEPNFRSRISGKEIPVADSPVSIAETRRRGDLRANKGIHYRDTTTNVLSSRSERARNEAQSDEDNTWVPDAMQYYKDRVDGIEHRINLLAVGMDSMMETLKRIEDALAERSEANVSVIPSVSVTLEGVDADIAQMLEGELQTRVSRLMDRKRAGSNNASH